jgi:dienelactone hydrolase
MEIQRQLIESNEGNLPSVIITPANPVGAAVIVHGYGGSKEEQLGLAWRIAEAGIVACAIDLRGHGQNTLLLDEKVVLDVESALRYCRRFGKVVAMGHSLGGRLSLVSNADYAVGISPALSTVFGKQTREDMKNLRKYKVRDSDSGDFLAVFRNIPVWESRQEKPALIIYGSRDMPEIVAACDEIKDIPVLKIEEALHGDIFLNEVTYEKITIQLQQWFQ